MITPKQNNEKPRSPTILQGTVSVAVVTIGTITYGTLGICGLVPVTVATFLLAALVQGLASAFLLLSLWRNRHSLNLLYQVFFVAWAGTMTWLSFPAVIIFVLTTTFNHEQLLWINFGWSWQMPILGGLLSGIYAAYLVRPIHNFLSQPKDGQVASRVYQQVLRYPLLVSIGFIVIATIEYSLVAWQLNVFAHVPVLEELKMATQGITSSILVSLFFYLTYDYLLRHAREYLEVEHKVSTIRRFYVRRILFITLVITFGSLILSGTIVFRSYQTFAEQALVSTMKTELGEVRVESEFRVATSPKQSAESKAHALGKLRLGSRGILTKIAPQTIPTEVGLAEETKAFIKSRAAGIVTDFHDEEKIIGFFTDEVSGQKVVSIAFVEEFYGPLENGLRVFIIGSIFIIVITTVITVFASKTISSSIQRLAQAVRQAQKTNESFTFDTYTGDELEDLAHAFTFYVNQAQGLQRDLERKVEERTAALMRIQEEKRQLEVGAAQREMFAEQSKRKTAEAQAEELEKKVQERTAELQEAVERLQELDQIKSDFVSTASHQLRTPLTAIRWAYHALLDESAGLTNEQKSIAAAGLQKTTVVMKLVNSLLDVTQLEEKKLTLSTTEVALDRLIQDVINDLKEIIANKDMQVDFHKPTKRLQPLALDDQKMRMAFTNILDNAVKYSHSGGQISITLEKVDEQYKVTVSDQGIGIPQEELKYMFTRFFRSQNAVRAHTDGSGLGLYIAKSMIEKHGGTITMQSKEGKGTQTIVLLPIKPNSIKPR